MARLSLETFAVGCTPRAGICMEEESPSPEVDLSYDIFVDEREVLAEDRAVQQAREMATRHAGVIVWSRHVKPDEGDFGEPEVVFRRGIIPPMD